MNFIAIVLIVLTTQNNGYKKLLAYNFVELFKTQQFYWIVATVR